MSCLPETLIFSVAGDETQGVRYVSATGPRRQLRCSAEEGVFSPTAKFAVEPAKDGLVHIRSCYDNHYWVRASTCKTWLYASAEKPENDITKDGCTLFEPRFNCNNRVSFIHYRSELNVVVSDCYTLSVGDCTPTQFCFVNYASLFKLPKCVMFKADNGFYLAPDALQPFQSFLTTSPTCDAKVAYETLFTRNGDIRIKSRSTSKPMFWSFTAPATDYFVRLKHQSHCDVPDPTTIFRLVALPASDGTCSQIGIRWVSTDYFFICRYYPTLLGAGFYLVATEGVSPDPGFTILSLADPCRSYVTVTEFRHPHRVTNQTSGQEDYTSSPLVFENESNQDVEEEIIPKDDQHVHHHRMEYRFINSITHGQCSAHFTAKMPFVTEQGQLVIPDYEVPLGLKDWGKTYEYCDEDNNNNCDSSLPLVTVPANTRVTATLFRKHATYKIPFSYKLSEEYHTGGGDTYKQDDGVFTGIYSYGPCDVRIDKTEPLQQPAASNTQD